MIKDKRKPIKICNWSCNHYGNKRYNYGFMSGAASYCYKYKKWITDMKTGDCQLINESLGKQEQKIEEVLK